jgi:hypothetical protein
MKHPRVVLLAVVIAALVVLILPSGMALAQSPAHVFLDDFWGWRCATGTYGIERFDDAYLSPNVSVKSDNGYVDLDWNYWYDYLDEGYETIWCFSHPIRSWGGRFNLYDANGPGSGIDVYMNGSWVYVGYIPPTAWWDFWGFVADQPFTAVRLRGLGETYYFDDMVWSTTVYYPGFIGKGGMRPGCLGPPTTLPSTT